MIPARYYQVPNVAALGRAFSPTDISGLTLWLKADAIVGLNDADPVATWTDSSSQGNNATQATGTKQPAYKTNIINGLGIVRFDGTTDFLAGSTTASATRHLFILVRKATAAGAASKSAFGLGAAGYAQMFTDTDNGTGYSWYANSIDNVSHFGGIATNWNLIELKFASGASLIPYINGAAGAAINPRDGHAAEDYDTVTTYALGAGTSNGGAEGDYDIGEVLLYDTALSDANRGLVETYLFNKWAVW